MENNTNLTNKQKALAIWKWTMRKYRGISVAYWILLFMSLPMIQIFWMIVTGSQEYRDYKIDALELAADLLGTVFTFVVIVFSMILSIIVFSYMHNKRSVDLFGSLPVSRRTLFFARYCAVVFASIVPMVVIGLLGIILTLNGGAALALLKTMGLLIIAIVGNTAVVAFISLCCGTVADVLISYLVMNVVYPVCVAILYLFPISVIPGLHSGYLLKNVFTFVCPVGAPFVGIWAGETKTYVLWWIFFSIVLLAGCYVLSKKRKAETAQNAFAFAAVEIVIKFVSCFAGGFCVGWVLAHVGDSYAAVKGQYIWFFIGVILGIFVTDILLHLIFHRGLSKFAKSLVECGVVFGVTAVFLFTVTSGAFGYDTRIPAVENIRSISVSNQEYMYMRDGKDLLAYNSTEMEDIDSLRQMHEKIIQQEVMQKRHGLYPILTGSFYHTTLDDGIWYGIKINYRLKSGRTVSRSYPYFGAENEFGFAHLKEHYAYPAKLVLNQIPFDYVDELMVDAYSRNAKSGRLVRHKNKIEMQELLEAAKKDWNSEAPYKSDKEKGDVVVGLDISYRESAQYGDSYYEIQIYENYANSIAVLKKYGYIR